MQGIPTVGRRAMQHSATNAEEEDRVRLSPEPATVLIVDDYQDCREMYAAYLTLAGFRVLKAESGLDGLALARLALPALILMDLGMPGVDGCEATRRLKQDPATRRIPVLALTAQCLPDAGALRDAGFAGVITKPCYPEELAERVSRVIGRPVPPVW
jgi:CheY-like chemotaxis protein